MIALTGALRTPTIALQIAKEASLSKRYAYPETPAPTLSQAPSPLLSEAKAKLKSRLSALRRSTRRSRRSRSPGATSNPTGSTLARSLPLSSSSSRTKSAPRSVLTSSRTRSSPNARLSLALNDVAPTNLALTDLAARYPSSFNPLVSPHTLALSIFYTLILHTDTV